MSSEFVVRPKYHVNHAGPVRYIWSYVRRYPYIALLVFIGAASNALLAAVLFYYVGIAFESIVAREAIGNEAAIRGVLGAVAGIVISQVVRSTLMLLRNVGSEIYGQRIERDVRDELYANLLGKSMDFHDKQPVGEIMARVTNDVRQLNLMMNPGINLIIGSGMFLVSPIIFSPFIHPSIVITPLAFMVLYIIAQAQFVYSLHGVAQEVRTSFGDMNASLAETLDGLQVVKGAAQEKRESARFGNLVDYVYSRFVRQGDLEAIYLPLLLWGIALFAGFIHAIYLNRTGIISLGQIVQFMGYLALFGFPVFVSLFAFSQIALGYASAKRILNIINTETDLDQNTDGRSESMQGAIRFEEVGFHYGDGKQIIHDVSFEVKPGQTVAIVGQTGAGKSTLTKLVNRTYDVDTGHVYVDGNDVREWNLAALRSQISIIEQDIFLFSRSIAENIAFGIQDAQQADIEAAAKMAQAHDFIMTFPDGYDTVIGQRGVTLSGGQRQRLAIARAFLTDPKVLILDDSTSAIDSETEDRIQKAIWTAAKGRTTVLITHRLSQIRWADHIIVLRKGAIVAQGKHDDLLATSEPYRRIFARYDEPTPQEVH